MELRAQTRGFLLNQNTDLNVIYPSDSCSYEFNWYIFKVEMCQIVITYQCRFASDLGKKLFNYFCAHIPVWLSSSYNKLQFVFALCALPFIYFSVTSLPCLIMQLFKENSPCVCMFIFYSKTTHFYVLNFYLDHSGNLLYSVWATLPGWVLWSS